MVKRTGYYLGHLFSKGGHAYRKTTSLEKTKIVIYTLLSILGRIFIFTRPLFALSNSNAGEMISKTGAINIEKSYKRTSHPGIYFPLLVFYVVRDLSIIAICAAIVSPVLLFNLIESNMKSDANESLFDLKPYLQYSDTIRLYFMIGLGVIAAIVAIVMLCRFAPANYIARTSKAHDVADVMHNCCEATHKRSKWAYFIVTFIPSVLVLAYLVLSTLIISSIFKFTDPYAYPIAVPIVTFLLVLLLITLFPPLFLGTITAQYEISRDTTDLEVVIVGEEQEDGSLVSQEDIYAE